MPVSSISGSEVVNWTRSTDEQGGVQRMGRDGSTLRRRPVALPDHTAHTAHAARVAHPGAPLAAHQIRTARGLVASRVVGRCLSSRGSPAMREFKRQRYGRFDAKPAFVHAVVRARASRPAVRSARTRRSRSAPNPTVSAGPAARPECATATCVPVKPRAARRRTQPPRRRPVPRPAPPSG